MFHTIYIVIITNRKLYIQKYIFMIIGLGNRKGGAGKTSLANALASHFAYSTDYDLKVKGIDVDNLQTWCEMRDDDEVELEDQLEANEITEEEYDQKANGMYALEYQPVLNFTKNIKKLIDGYDLIFVDLPGSFDQLGVPEAYLMLDHLIIPTNVTRQDVNGTMNFIKNYIPSSYTKRVEAGFEATQIHGVLSKVKKNTSAFRQRAEDLKENGLKNEFGIEFIQNVITDSDAVFGTYANTYSELKNGSNVKVFTEVFKELASRMGIPSKGEN